MAGITEAIWQLRDSLKAKAARPSTSKAAATVSRVEPDGTVWVRLAGSDGETPITKPTTAEVSAGDSVTVEIGRGSSRLVGNSSTPAVGAAQVTTIVNPVAEVAAQAVTDAATAATAATEATESAAVAKAAADSANANLKSVVSGAQTVEKAVSVMQTALEAVVDYDPATDTTTEWFWHDADGAHVLGETSGYRNDIDSTGMHIVDVSDETEVAQFAASGAQIGKSGAAHSVIDADGQRFYGGSDGTTQLANIGYGSGASASGTAVAPYYTFGTRLANSTVGNYSVANGTFVTASGYASHAEGTRTEATGGASHAEGSGTEASGNYSHAEGSMAMATGNGSHAEGLSTVASGLNSHAEGSGTGAGGDYSHAEGESAEARGKSSHAQNEDTVAAKRAQSVLGTRNIEDTSATTTHPSGNTDYGEYALIIGNGTSAARSNALTVDWDGNVECGTVNGATIASPLVKIAYTTVSVNMTAGSNASVTAASVTGYTFVGWVSCATNGWVASCYVADPTSSSSTVYVAAVGWKPSGTTGQVRCAALYVAG